MIKTFLGCIALFVLVGVVGSLEQRCERRENMLRSIDDDTYFTARQHVTDSLGHEATSKDVADYLIRKEGI